VYFKQIFFFISKSGLHCDYIYFSASIRTRREGYYYCLLLSTHKTYIYIYIFFIFLNHGRARAEAAVVAAVPRRPSPRILLMEETFSQIRLGKGVTRHGACCVEDVGGKFVSVCVCPGKRSILSTRLCLCFRVLFANVFCVYIYLYM